MSSSHAHKVVPLLILNPHFQTNVLWLCHFGLRNKNFNLDTIHHFASVGRKHFVHEKFFSTAQGKPETSFKEQKDAAFLLIKSEPRPKEKHKLVKNLEKAMASGAGKSAAFGLLILNVFLYLIVISFAAWAVNHGIEKSRETASVLSLPARIFPIYFPFGNLATGFVLIFSLIAGVVGFTTSITGINNVLQWNPPNLNAAAASSLLSLMLTLLAMGLACKEIDIGWTGSNIRTLETILILVSGTQLFCTAAIQMGLSMMHSTP